MTTLLIGCGFLGTRVGVLLAKRGERVVGTVRSAARAAEIASFGIEPVVADVLNPQTLRDLPAAERVFYCVGFDRSSGASMRSVYVDGLANVLDNLPRSASRFVYASSTGVFGQTEGEWVDETTPPVPQTESGKICLEAERQLVGWAKRSDTVTSVTVLRFAGLYGPGRVVRRTLVEQGEPIPGDPSKLLNLIHVDDASSAAVAALSLATPEPLYLIADDRPVTRREYYGLVAMLLDAPAPRFIAPEVGSPEHARDASSKRVGNHRMKAGLGVELAFPDIKAGLPATLGV
jgi:nucleoside-diphosphate-sugar epimerase